MKKLGVKIAVVLAVTCFSLSSCTVSYISTADLRSNYEKKIYHTTMLGKALFKTDKRKMDTYENVQVLPQFGITSFL